MARWLLKSEPEHYGWADLVRDGGTEWNGVRNHAAAGHLRAMKVGDLAFIYHSMSEKAVVGVARITREAEKDGEEGNWVSVAIEPVDPLSRPVTLATVKAEPRLSDLCMVRQSRLSVSPVSDAEWAVILELAG